MNAPLLLDAKNLCRDYGALRAVADVTVTLAAGEVLGLLGPNGAGKSTTMQMLTGCLAPTRGQVIVNGIDLLDEPRRAKRHIGYLPEQPPVYRDLTVDEYLKLAARLHGVQSPAVDKAVATAKSRCGLGDVGGRVIGNLSKGYQQRVGIAQAIVHSPAVVILDEPTVGLDPIQIGEIRALIREIGREHGVILSTHILPEVESVCTRVQIVCQGRTVFGDLLEGLAERHAAPVLTATLDRAPDETTLAAIPGTRKIERIGERRFRITHDGKDYAALLADMAAAKGWRLTELSPERASLEQIFTQLVYREGAAAA